MVELFEQGEEEEMEVGDELRVEPERVEGEGRGLLVGKDETWLQEV